MKEFCPICNKLSVKVTKYANWLDRTHAQDSYCETPDCYYRHEIKNNGNIYLNGKQVYPKKEGLNG